MAAISSLGIGSGLDLASIVEGLVEAERAPTEARLNFREEGVTTELSAFGALKSSVSLFRGSLGALKFKTSLAEQQIKLSDPSVFTVATSGSAETGSYDIEVEALATRHSLATHPDTAFADINAEIGSGTLTLRYGTTTESPYGFVADGSKATETITVSQENGNTSLTGLKNYLNENDFGVQASIINDGSGYRLVLTSEQTGAANSMEITVSDDADADDTDNAGLSQLAFNATAQDSVVQTVAAQDASLSINGLSISRDNNKVEGAIEGVTLNLLKADLGNAVNVDIGVSYSQAEAGIREFIDGYNSLVVNIKTLTSYNAATENAGVLLGDFTVRNILNDLENLMTRQTGAGPNIRSLTDLGITTQSDGTLAVDNDALAEAFEDHPEEVEVLFINRGASSDAQVNYLSASATAPAGTYPIFVEAAASRGQLDGTAIGSLTIDADNDELVIAVNGTTSNTISLTPGSYADGAALAAHIEQRINADSVLKADQTSVAVSWDADSNSLQIRSALYGSSSTVELVSVDIDSAADLGLSPAVGVPGSNIEGRINGLTASGNGTILTALGSPGISVEVLGESVGNRGAITITQGQITSVDEMLGGFLRFDGVISAREEGLSARLEDIADERRELQLRIASLEARFVKQFAALDGLIAQFNSTSSFLETQLANLPEPNQVGRR